MSFFGFNIAGSALTAYQDAENVTSQNIANVSVTGASQQVANLVDQAPVSGSPFLPANQGVGTLGDGILMNKVLRVHQDSYDALFRGANSAQNYYNVEEQQLNATQSALGEPSAGINTAYQAFQSAVQELTSAPTGSAQQNGVLSAANNLVSVLNSSSAAISSQETQIQQQAGSVVTQINTLTAQIGELNGEIRASSAAGDNPNTYLDDRDELIDQLSSLVGVQTQLTSNGSCMITVGGKALVNDTVVYQLAQPVLAPTANGQTQLVVGFQNDPNPANPVPISTGGQGELGGYLGIYNNNLQSYQTSLNNFASTLAAETDRITQGGYDETGTAGGQLFQPAVSGQPIGAGNIEVGIANSAEFPSALASTAAGSLVQPLNAANNTVDTSASIIGNTTMSTPPAAAFNGSLTINVDGIAQTYQYSTVAADTTLTAAAAAGTNTIQVQDATGLAAGDVIVVGQGDDQETATIAAVAGNTITLTANLANNHTVGEQAGGNAGTIDDFINSFNAGHYGVDASFDTSTESIVFSRDPTNIDLVHRAAMEAAGSSTTPDFMITDSNAQAGFGGPPPSQAPLGTNATNLLTALGANAINGVDQNATNAVGTNSPGNANALFSFFSTAYGVPAIQTTSSTAIAGPGVVTVTVPSAQPFQVGDILTIDATSSGGPPQENVTVSAVNYNTNQITFTAANAHAAGFSITSAQTQTLQNYYSAYVANMGLDVQNATNGNTSQTNLANSINQVRQGIDGINIDEQTQNLMMYQNAYGAAAHTIDVLNSLLGLAVNVGTGTSF